MTNFTLSGKHVMAAMLVFFAVVIAVNGAFVFVALRSFPGEEVKRSYLQGLNYNATLAERRRERALGWRAETELSGAAHATLLRARLTDREGRGLDGLTIEALLRRPADSAHDLTLTFAPRGDGLYVAEVPALAAGVWDLRATAERGEQRFSFARRHIWAPQP